MFSEEYAVVVCSECESPFIISGNPETTKCRKCGENHVVEDMRKVYTTNQKENARRVRGAVVAELKGKSEKYEELIESGALDNVSEAISDEEYIKRIGGDSEVTSYSFSTAGSNSTSNDREKVMEIIEDESPISEKTIQEKMSEFHDVKENTTEKIIEKLIEHGEISDRDGKRENLVPT